MLTVSNLTKSFSDQILFDQVSFQINQAEKVGFIGKNGYGKTTLFKILMGLEEYDSGTISLPRHYQMGYVQQHLQFKEQTLLDEAQSGLPADQKEKRWLAEKILFGLGFQKEQMSMPPQMLSGGFQVRLNLAKVLLAQPDLLLLDEPTNYLDITSIRWLVTFLKKWPGELLLVTHDRSFMDAVVTHSMIIHRLKVKKIKGTTSKLYQQIAREEEIFEKQRVNDEKKRAEIERFINRFRAKATLATLVQSRIKMLDRQEKHDRLSQIKTLDFQFSYQPIAADVVSQVEQLEFAYPGGSTLIRELSFLIRKKDRIAIVGPNGKGKTTLLKLLARQLQPAKGQIWSHHLLTTGYFAQTNQLNLNQKNTVADEISQINPALSLTEIRNICGTLLFEGDYALKPIHVLSGGEKARVILGQILVNPANLLLLDEPTNHLDMDSCDALLTALDHFEGAVLMVTHDEMFLHAIAERLIVFDNERVFLFEGSYQAFLDQIGWVDERENQKDKPNLEFKKQEINRKEARKKRAQLITEKNKQTRPLEKKIDQLTRTIEEVEQKLKKCENQLIEASEQSNGALISELSRQIHEYYRLIAENYAELDQLLQELDHFNLQYQAKLDDFEANSHSMP